MLFHLFFLLFFAALQHNKLCGPMAKVRDY
jgi:hypothetical protein